VCETICGVVFLILRTYVIIYNTCIKSLELCQALVSELLHVLKILQVLAVRVHNWGKET